MWHVWGTGEVCAGFWWRDLMDKGHLEDIGVDGMIILKLICKWNREAGTGLLLLRIWAGDGRFWVRYITYVSHKTKTNFLTSWGHINLSGRNLLVGVSEAGIRAFEEHMILAFRFTALIWSQYVRGKSWCQPQGRNPISHNTSSQPWKSQT